MMRSRKLQSLVLFLGCIFAISAVAQADTVNFSFNSIGLTTLGSYQHANDAAVQTTLNSQFQSQLGITNKLTVTGAAATNDWLGDGHVVGGISGSLGAGGNTYLINENGQEVGCGGTGQPSCSSGILMDFTNSAGTAQDNFIYNVTFSLEIFPDGSCSTITNCGSTSSPYSPSRPQNLPDFEFYAGTSMSAVRNSANLLYTKYACVPGAPGCSVTSTASPNSPSGGELAPQLGPLTVSFSFTTPVSVLDFEDWPATIGVSNVAINTPGTNVPTNTPEPSSLLLLGMGLSGLAVIRRRYALRRQ